MGQFVKSIIAAVGVVVFGYAFVALAYNWITEGPAGGPCGQLSTGGYLIGLGMFSLGIAVSLIAAIAVDREDDRW